MPGSLLQSALGQMRGGAPGMPVSYNQPGHSIGIRDSLATPRGGMAGFNAPQAQRPGILQSALRRPQMPRPQMDPGTLGQQMGGMLGGQMSQPQPGNAGIQRLAQIPWANMMGR